MTAVRIPPKYAFRGVSAIHKRDRDKRGYRCPRERVFIIQRCMWFIRKIRTGIKAFLTIRYTWGETKVAAARDHVENGLTKTEVMAKYAIASIAPLERWCREYRAGGPEALRPRPKGSKSKPKPEPTREQELAERVRPPADTHVPGPRVRTEGVGQERARGHAAHGTEMRHPLQEPVEEVQLVQGRDGRSRA